MPCILDFIRALRSKFLHRRIEMDPIGSASTYNTERRYEWNILKGHEIVFAYPLLLTIYDET